MSVFVGYAYCPQYSKHISINPVPDLNCHSTLWVSQSKGYRVLVLDCPGADPAVGLPEPDSVVVPGRGQDDRVAAHRALVHIHAWLLLLAVTAHSEAWKLCNDTAGKCKRQSADAVLCPFQTG